LIGERDYATYRELYLVLIEFLPPPDLVVYLRASPATLMKRIRSRGRDYERRITTEYLEKLDILYEEWIHRFSLCPVLTVPADELDYVAHDWHLELVVRKIQEKLTGKEEVIFDPDEVNGQARD
jgi:deoxyadenosine/deoxycytidine kinase